MLKFKECPYCGKSVRENAASCHRCGRSLTESDSWTDFESTEHHADGGYSADLDDSDFQDDALVDERLPLSGRPWTFLWRSVAWFMIALFLLPALVQLFAIVSEWVQ